MLNSCRPTSSTCAHDMVNFSPLTAEMGSLVWGTPANFNRFRVLASLLYRRRSTEVNQILHDVWQSCRLVHYVYISGGSCPVTEFWPVQNIRFASKSCVLLYWQRYCTSLKQSASAKLCGVQQKAPPIFSRAAITLASAHLLVILEVQNCFATVGCFERLLSSCWKCGCMYSRMAVT